MRPLLALLLSACSVSTGPTTTSTVDWGTGPTSATCWWRQAAPGTVAGCDDQGGRLVYAEATGRTEHGPASGSISLVVCDDGTVAEGLDTSAHVAWSDPLTEVDTRGAGEDRAGCTVDLGAWSTVDDSPQPVDATVTCYRRDGYRLATFELALACDPR